MNKLDIGMSVSVLCNVYSREFKGKYYTSLDGYHFTDKTNAGESSADDFVTSDNDMPF